MPSNYVAIGIFIVFSIIVPVSLVFTSIMLGYKRRNNAVSELNFESAEESVGSKITIMSEYFHYFTGFLAFEILTGIILAWAYVINFTTLATDIYIIGLLILSMIFLLFIMFFSLKRFWRSNGLNR
ncbi:MAG: NADH-quinone oxidoreductase subunit A [Candidatus Micrarchaeia archaeon]